MISLQSCLLKRLAEGPKTKFKILTSATHEGYQTTLAETGHEFYLLSGHGLKTWDFHTRPLPKNTYLYNAPANQIRGSVDFDLVLAQNRTADYPILLEIASKHGLPIVVLDHTEPPPGATKAQMKHLREFRGNANVFITEHNKKTWEGAPEDVVIPHGLDTTLFRGWTGETPSGLSVVNLFPQRDVFCGWTLWSSVTAVVPVRLLGFNPGLSESINDVQKLIEAYRASRFYLNTSQHSPVPLSMLEAMACGCPVVTTDKQEIGKLIRHGENGLMSNDPAELIEYCQILLADASLAAKLGAAARQTIIEKHGLQQYCDKWNGVFQKVYGERL